MALIPDGEIVIRTLPDAFWLSLAPIIASVGGLIVAIGTLVVSLRVSHKADVIHAATNSNLTTVTNKLDLANGKIEEMQKLVNSMTASASAARAATTAAVDAAGRQAKETP